MTEQKVLPRKHSITAQNQQSVMEQLWLTYYNDTLYEKGVITETERNRMRIRIKTRAASDARPL
ncbi:MAG: hypothetical protein VB055_05840 [Oscillospiraceae bacterium]|nr:hypothetical protein [Oscillospiraceae bacterium]